MWSLHHCMGFSLVAAEGSYSLVVVCRFLLVVASLIEELRPLGTPASGVGSSRSPEHWISNYGTQA